MKIERDIPTSIFLPIILISLTVCLMGLGAGAGFDTMSNDEIMNTMPILLLVGGTAGVILNCFGTQQGSLRKRFLERLKVFLFCTSVFPAMSYASWVLWVVWNTLFGR